MSTEIQAKYGDSERRQIEAVERYARLHGLCLAPPMRDLGISAFKGRHRKKGALGPFLAAIQAGEIEPGTLIIEAIDRLSREEPMTIISMLNDILRSGFVIHILSQNQTFDLDAVNQQSGFLSNLAQRAEMAHAESKQKSERIAEAYVTRRNEARAGKRLKGNYHPTWIKRHYNGNEVTFTVDEEAAASILMAFELARDTMGAHMIAKTLNERGIPAPPAPSLRKSAVGKPRRWYQSHVGRVLTDRRVLGEYQPMRIIDGRKVPEGDPIPGHFPAIISPELFLAVQKARSPKLGRKQGARNGEFANLFTNGLAVCGCCGERMLIRGDYRKGEKTSRHYLRCARQSTGFKCENTRTPRYEWFERKVLDALPAVPWGELLKRSSPESQVEALERAVAESEAEIERLTRASARLLKLIESDDDEPDAQALERRQTIRTELKTEKALHADLIIELNDARSNDKEAQLLDELGTLRLAMNTADKTERVATRQKVHSILARIVETAMFFRIHAQVNIRGGMCLTVPLDEEGSVGTGWYMGGHHAFVKQTKKDGIPPLVPSEDGRTLVEKKGRFS